MGYGLAEQFQRRMLWHRAWEEYGNKLGKELVKNGGINSPIHDDLPVEGKWYSEIARAVWPDTAPIHGGEAESTST